MDNLKNYMVEINQLSNEIDSVYHDIAQNYGISDSVYWILYIIYYSDTPISQIELCDCWSYSKQTVNSSITSMIKKGLITLEVIPGTRNKKRILLTSAGRELSASVIGETKKIEQAMFSKYSEKEMEKFITMFRNMTANMREEYENKQSHK